MRLQHCCTALVVGVLLLIAASHEAEAVSGDWRSLRSYALGTRYLIHLSAAADVGSVSGETFDLGAAAPEPADLESEAQGDLAREKLKEQEKVCDAVL